MPQRLRSRIYGKRTVKCGKNVADPGVKLVTSRRSADQNESTRAERRARKCPRRKDPHPYFSPTGDRGRVERNTTRTQTIPEISDWRTRPNFLAKFFGKKILEIKIVR